MNEIPGPSEPEKQIDNIKRFKRRDILIRGSAIAGGSVIGQLLCYKLGIGLFKDRDPQLNLPKGDPFENREEVNADRFYDKQYGGKIMNTALSLPVLNSAIGLEHDLSEKQEAKDLKIALATIHEASDKSGLVLSLDFDGEVKIGENYNSGEKTPAFVVVFPEKQDKKERVIDVRFFSAKESAAFYLRDENDSRKLIGIDFLFRNNLDAFSNKDLVFFFNKGFTGELEDKPKFLPFRFRVPQIPPHVPSNQKSA
jgi:hypothetical protein